ncbi:MAG: type II toxin-antitoxin system HicA family toxin [Nitrospira sp.]|nr:type II toxin-antitoxin system HicA family toxin [Nitrospira sp.]
MPTYDDFRKVLKQINFRIVRSKKHETWQKILPDGTILQVRLSHKHGKDIPKALFHKMLKQAQIIEEDFKRFLR